MQKLSRISCKILTQKYLFHKKSTHGLFLQRLYTTYELPLAAGYQPKEVEARNEKLIVKNEKSNNGICKKGTFRMILPPPNVTGNLHLGHALMATVQDVICRQRRQLGLEVEWIPGTDHAGIATQVVVEKKLLHEKSLTRHEIGRDAFISEVFNWKDEKCHTISEDLKKLGCTLDWDKQYFTMDEWQAQAVSTAFIKLFDDGVIKRQKSLVNWSCALESAISDIEVETVEIKGPTEVVVPGYKHNVLFGRLYDFAYRVVDSDNMEEIVVSTTRPETILGDVAVAVHPEDERYIAFRNRPTVQLMHPLRHKPIPLIFDASVDREFGTGAVKITPAHDKLDFEIASRHNLEAINIFSEDGKILDSFDQFKGQPRFMARDRILDSLEEMNLLRLVKGHTMNIPFCARSHDIIEYMLRPQWFVHCQPLANAASSAVRSGNLQIIPPNFETEWYRWLENCRDWCISRQLWWGHQIPAYLAEDETGKTCWVAAMNEEEALKKASEKLESKVSTIKRDSDVLDTWFSSSLLPFSAHKWPSAEYKNHYPLDLMETGHDILFFWVARMVMLGLQLTGELPFKAVLLNGLVCDTHGRKMSKSLGNVVSPQQVIKGATLEDLKVDLQKSFDGGILNENELEASIIGLKKMFPKGIEECGTDALRFTLCSHNIKNHFINFDVGECYTNKLFLNKIWQATRFTLGAAQRLGISLREIESMNNVELGIWDRWIISRLSNTMTICAQSFDNYNLHTATAALKQFLYTNLCDAYLETTKANINAVNPEGFFHCATLATCLSWSLQAMAPFTPFIAQDLLQHFQETTELNLRKFQDDKLEKEVADVLDICHSIRQLKSRNQISKKHEPIVCLMAHNPEAMEILSRHIPQIKVLTKSHSTQVVMFDEDISTSKKFTFVSSAGHLCNFGIALNQQYFGEAKDAEALSKQNESKLKKLLTDLQRYQMRAENEAFQLMASKKVQQDFAEKIRKLEAEIENLRRLPW